jgi:hypothetical protein
MFRLKTVEDSGIFQGGTSMPLSLAFKGGGESTFGFQRGGGGSNIGQRGSPLSKSLAREDVYKYKVANEVERFHHHHHKMVSFTLGILQRHMTYGYMGKSQWRIQDFLNGAH